MNDKNRSLGFTLMELLIALAIVGLLSAIAYPNYRQYILRAHRAEGLTALQQTATRMERYFSNNSEYPADMATLGIPNLTENEYYAVTIGIGACGDPLLCYILTADAQGAQVDDDGCTSLRLDSTGVKTPLDCW